MYDLIANLIDHSWVQGDSMQQYIVYICGALIMVLVSVFIDLVYRIFSHFWRRG